MKKQTLSIVLVLMAIAPIIYVAIVWNTIPDIVPTHFNLRGEPDHIGPKGELWIPIILLAAASIFTYFLLNNLQYFDPKRAGQAGKSGFHKLSVSLVIFLTLLNFLIIYAAINGGQVFKTFLFPLLGILYLTIGNYMANIKPNYVAGFRLPWTLSNNDNWRRTHQLAGKLWFGAGLFLLLAGFIFSFKIMFPVFITTTIIVTLIPTIYSYRLFKTSQLHKPLNS